MVLPTREGEKPKRQERGGAMPLSKEKSVERMRLMVKGGEVRRKNL